METKIDTHSSKIHDRSVSWLITGTSIKSGVVKLVLWVQISPSLSFISATHFDKNEKNA